MNSNKIAATDQTLEGLCFGPPNQKKNMLYGISAFFCSTLSFSFLRMVVRSRAQVEGVAASLKKTQVQGQSSPERRLSEEQKERLKKQVSIWAEGTRKDVTDEG